MVVGVVFGVFFVLVLLLVVDFIVFDVLDKNKDGMIIEGEILLGQDVDIIVKFDIDGFGGVSQVELEVVGNCIVIKKIYEDGEEGGKMVIKKMVKIFEFSDDKDGEIYGEVSIKIEKYVVVKCIEGGDEFLEEELLCLFEEVLSEFGVGEYYDVEVDVIVEKIMEEMLDDE